MRKPLEKVAKVLLRNHPKSKRFLQARDQSIAVQPSSTRALEIPLECPFKPSDHPNLNSTTTTANNNNTSSNLSNTNTNTNTNRTITTKTTASASWSSRTVPVSSAECLSSSSQVEVEQTKPWSLVPSPRGGLLKNFFEFLRAGGGKNIHDYSFKRHEQLGHIYKENIAGMETLFIAHPSAFHDVHSQEGDFPHSMTPESFEIYNRTSKNPHDGIFFMVGEEWWTTRRQVSPVMLKRSKTDGLIMKAYEEYLIQLIAKWENIVHSNGGQLPDIESEAYEWSVEGVAFMVFGRNYHGMWSKVDTNLEELVRKARIVTEQNCKMLVAPPKLAKRFNMKIWRTFETALNDVLQTAKTMSNICIDDLEKIDPKKVNPYEQGGLLYRLKNETNLPRDLLLRVTNGFVATPDPPAITLLWVLYNLGRHPEIQESMYQDIKNVCGQAPVNLAHLEDLKSVRMALKETLRLYPTAPFLARVLRKKTVIDGYEVPAGKLVAFSTYATHRNSEFFPDPLRFWPGRWSRTNDNHIDANTSSKSSGDDEKSFHRPNVGVNNPYAYQPFGIGKRSCMGKLAAQNLIHMLTARIVQNFKFECEEVSPIMRTVLVPDKPLRIRMTKRSDT